ncbi:ABC transporter, solute-binding protein [Gardnerella vaginalis]|uniref:ABC transporter, solute-binding protein n=1 Tax=Gardnerella vaginalis TaxID=2702 RepID=A0A133NXH7_GARVA|nr:extracellular solute-binding protein [Gardnerella vaginalis]KXA20970.1 ABC transporter, solute-binding protein [Gardnerella vaginalis]
MTNIKKMLGAGLAVATLFGFAACGSSTTSTASSDTKTAKLTVWAASEDQAKGDSWLPTMEKAFQKAHPEYKITFKNAVVAPPDASKTVKQDAKAAADVYLFANDQLGDLVQAGAIGELSDDAVAQVKQQDAEPLIQSVTAQDGKMYGVPFTGNTWFMYYDKSKFTDEDVKSLDKMLEKGKVAFNIANAWYLPGFYLDGNMTLFGPKSNDGKAGIKLSDKAAAVTKYVAKLIQNKNFVMDNDEGAGLAAIQNHTADAFFSGSWQANDVKKALGDNYAAAQLPKFKTEAGEFQMKSFAGSKAVAYNPNSKAPEIAAKFAAFLGSKESQKKYYELQNTIPSDKSLADIVKGDPAAVAQMNTIANTSVLQPTVPEMGGFWDPTKTFGTSLAHKEINDGNAAAKTADWAKGFAEALKK